MVFIKNETEIYLKATGLTYIKIIFWEISSLAKYMLKVSTAGKA